MTDKKFYRNSIISTLFTVYIVLFWVLPIWSEDGYWFTIGMVHLIILIILLLSWFIAWLAIKYEEAG